MAAIERGAQTRENVPCVCGADFGGEGCNGSPLVRMLGGDGGQEILD